jgi:tetratricopeptide (TPR) repeat protein
MKNQMPYGALKVPISLSDAEIEKISPIQWGDFQVKSVAVPLSAYPDSIKAKGTPPDKLAWRMPYSFASGNVKAVKVQDLMIFDIVKTNNWQRPIYFSATVTEDNFIGLEEYLVQEGMGKRLVPFKADGLVQFRIDPERMWANFMVTPANYSKTPQDGYFFHGFDNPNIFYDQVSENNVQNYRSQYLTMAYYYNNLGDKAKTLQVLNKMEQNFPGNVVAFDYRVLYDAAMLYLKAGDRAKFDQLTPEVEAKALDALKKNPGDIQSYWNPYKLLIDIYEARGDNQRALEILYQLDRITPNNPEIKAKIEALKQGQPK